MRISHADLQNPDRLPAPVQRTIALAGMIQALVLVDTHAYGRSVHDEHQDCLIQSLFNTAPENFSSILPGIEPLTLGISALRRMLVVRSKESDIRLLHYLINVIQLTQAFLKRSDQQQIVTTTLRELEAKYSGLADRTQPNALTELAQLYRTTLGQLSPTIEVKGQVDALQNPVRAANIRALLLAAVRLCFLWHQLGGRRWQLLLQRGKLLAILNQLYDTLCH